MMRIVIVTLFTASLFFSCKSGDGLSLEQKSSVLREQIADTVYVFVPRTAIPVGGKNISLDNSYSLKVTKDTIEAYLPYFGRAYTAPMSSSSGGIKFLSTDFAYTLVEKKKGVWDVVIDIKDQPNSYKLRLNVGDSGYGTLSVQEVNRQSISFYGMLE